jgi:ATP-binding cassette subfamily B protein
MRRDTSPPAPPPAERRDWQTIRTLFPYLWQWRGRIILALVCLIGAKLANVGVPLIFKDIVDGFAQTDPGKAFLIVPIALIAAYGILRFCVSLFTELRELLFARVTQRAVRSIALQVFEHLHALSLRFHLERQTGGLTRDIERGTRSISTLISYTIFSVLPTFVEVLLVLGILAARYEPSFVLIASFTLIVYIGYTIILSNWRVHLRREVNELDSAANTRAIDSLLNYETVKYFNNEGWERSRYDQHMQKWEIAQIRSQHSLSWLNLGQAAIIAVGVSLMMGRAAIGVSNGTMTVGDIVLVNAFLIQLYIPLNFLGVLYREIRQSLIDIERLFALLAQNEEIKDAPLAGSLEHGPCSVSFDDVSFGYDERRPILHSVSFNIPAGHTVAIVGHSGSGKSTIARLLFRFYDLQAGTIRINGLDIRDISQQNLRTNLGIVPQDTVLFNETLAYNIRYGRTDATDLEIVNAARSAHLEEFIDKLPDRYETRVGERGLKLSGGEKQRVAIARTLLKNPPILIFDEATSALDSQTEKLIQSELDQASLGRTTLIIAHRLSTVMNADEILVLKDGRIIERGSHIDLLQLGGNYSRMWSSQQKEELNPMFQ